MTSKHTPGPWTHKLAGEVQGPDGLPVAYASAWRMTDGDAESGTGPASANARLIAAAPDLLAALEVLNAECIRLAKLERNGGIAKGGEPRKLFDQVQAAIAKATGAA